MSRVPGCLERASERPYPTSVKEAKGVVVDGVQSRLASLKEMRKVIVGGVQSLPTSLREELIGCVLRALHAPPHPLACKRSPAHIRACTEARLTHSNVPTQRALSYCGSPGLKLLVLGAKLCLLSLGCHPPLCRKGAQVARSFYCSKDIRASKYATTPLLEVD